VLRRHEAVCLELLLCCIDWFDAICAPRALRGHNHVSNQRYQGTRVLKAAPSWAVFGARKYRVRGLKWGIVG
jgi:hypothetical protein